MKHFSSLLRWTTAAGLLLALAASVAACGSSDGGSSQASAAQQSGTADQGAAAQGVATAVPGPPPVVIGVSPFGTGTIEDEFGNDWNSVYAGLEDNGVSVDCAACELWVDGAQVTDLEIVMETSDTGAPVVHYRIAEGISYSTPRDVKVIIVTADGQRATYTWNATEGG